MVVGHWHLAIGEESRRRRARRWEKWRVGLAIGRKRWISCYRAHSIVREAPGSSNACDSMEMRRRVEELRKEAKAETAYLDGHSAQLRDSRIDCPSG